MTLEQQVERAVDWLEATAEQMDEMDPFDTGHADEEEQQEMADELRSIAALIKKLAADTKYDTLAQLQKEASDDEADMVERLAIKAGFWWKCSPGDCNYVNPKEIDTCESCGTKKE